MIVSDASVVVAAVSADELHRSWAADVIDDTELTAPHLMPAEVTSRLRRGATRGEMSEPNVTRAQTVLAELVVEYFPFAPFAGRIWQLRHTVTPYDAWYVALAEALDAPLATLDRRLARADGPRCEFLMP